MNISAVINARKTVWDGILEASLIVFWVASLLALIPGSHTFTLITLAAMGLSLAAMAASALGVYLAHRRENRVLAEGVESLYGYRLYGMAPTLHGLKQGPREVALLRDGAETKAWMALNGTDLLILDEDGGKIPAAQ